MNDVDTNLLGGDAVWVAVMNSRLDIDGPQGNAEGEVLVGYGGLEITD